LSTDWQTTKHPDREQVSKAREAAEALFRPKQQGTRAEPPMATSISPQLGTAISRREPRIIAAPMGEVKVDASTGPEPKQQRVRAEPPMATLIAPPLGAATSPPREPRNIAAPLPEVKVEASTDPKSKPHGKPIKPRASKVPASQHDRIRTLASYGMTLEQVADLYGVPVGKIERIVGPAHDGDDTLSIKA
jgi:hypothetical protein